MQGRAFNPRFAETKAVTRSVGAAGRKLMGREAVKGRPVRWERRGGGEVGALRPQLAKSPSQQGRRIKAFPVRFSSRVGMALNSRFVGP